jgi:hypothetical protein
VLAAAAMFGKLYAGAATGKPKLDRWQIRARVVFQVIKQCPSQVADPKHAQQLVDAMMAIINNESGGDPKNYIGDDGLPAAGGASIGPGNVSFATAKDLAIVPSSETLEQYKARAPDEHFGIKAAVTVFRDKLRTHGNDIAKAIRAYNGGGDAATKYASKALAFEEATYGVKGGES